MTDLGPVAVHRGQRDRQRLCVSLLHKSSRSSQTARGVDQVVVEASARANHVCAGLNRLCQVLLATTFAYHRRVAAGGIRLQGTIAAVEENPLDVQIRQSVATVLMPGYPPVIFKYDSTQPDHPVYVVECHSKLISDEQVRRLLHTVPMASSFEPGGHGHLGQCLVRFELRAGTLRS